LEDEPDPAYSSDFSSLTNIIPDSEGAPVLQLSTYPPLPELVESMTANELGKMGVKMEANIGGASSELTLKNIPLPLDIEIERQVWQTEDNILSIQIGVRNRDTSPAYDIVIDDLMSFEEYKGVESEGNAYHEVHFLGPGETYFFEYNVKVKNQGSYTLEPVYFSYLNGDNRFEAKSKPTSVQLDRPTDFENLGNTVSTIFNMDDDLSEHLPSNVSTGIQLSTYAVILYSVVSSIMGLRKWILS
jgi:hypothetical protein